MADTEFTDYVTPVPAAWLNDVNDHVYNDTPVSPATTVHDASVIANTPAGSIAATTVQAAIDELDTEKAALAGSASQAFTALSLTSVGKVSGATVTGTETSSAVVGVASTTGYGVYGSSGSGPAVVGVSTTGYGVYALSGDSYALVTSGGAVKAPIRVIPSGEPTGSNQVGAIYVTSAGVLKICTVDGTPGTWVSVGAQT